MRARDLMSTPAVTAAEETSVRDAAKLLYSYGFTALPVVDQERHVIGMISEGDIVRGRFAPGSQPPSPTERETGSVEAAGAGAGAIVADVMTTPVVVVDGDADVVDVVTVMLDEHVRTVPVGAAGRLIGVVTQRDLVRALTGDDEGLAADVRHRVQMYSRARG
jgi:CBS domain-containing protein